MVRIWRVGRDMGSMMWILTPFSKRFSVVVAWADTQGWEADTISIQGWEADTISINFNTLSTKFRKSIKNVSQITEIQKLLGSFAILLGCN